jgi:type II secretory pathway pseudopilin PulG
MTKKPNESIAEETARPGKIPNFVWLLGGCSCFGVGCLPIMGILVTIIIPSLLNVSGTNRNSEAKATLGTVNRAQQAYHLANGSFSNSIEKLDEKLGPKFFAYQVVLNAPKLSVFTTATPVDPTQKLKSYVGFVFLVNPATSEFISGVCGTENPSRKQLVLPLPKMSSKKVVECPLSFNLL